MPTAASSDDRAGSLLPASLPALTALRHRAIAPDTLPTPGQAQAAATIAGPLAGASARVCARRRAPVVPHFAGHVCWAQGLGRLCRPAGGAWSGGGAS